jgi:type I restriction enzyme S subunit
MSEFPQGWVETTSNEVCEYITSGSRDWKKYYSDEGAIFIRTQDINKDVLNLSNVAYVKLPEKVEGKRSRVEPGDLLVTITGANVGKVAVVPDPVPEAYVSQSVGLMRLKDKRIAKFLHYYLQSEEVGRKHLLNMVYGMGRPVLSLQNLRDIRITLPPLSEQRRIVARIEELFSRIDAGVAALRHAKAQLQRYRQSVLAAAVTGQLTQAWREQHPDTEPASALRRCLLETRQLRWTGKYHSPVPAALEQSRAIPESWAWMSADELIREPLKNGLSLKGFTNPPGVAVLKLDALNENGLDYSKRQYLRTDSSKVAEIQIEKGDFLISRGNGSLRLLAKGVLADVVPDNVIFPDTMIRFRFPSALQRWISVAWRSRVLREQIEGRAKSTAGIYKIAQGDLRPIAIPIPPLAEQHQIVAEVEARSTAIDHLEAELDRQITRSNRLRQSTLTSAFAGILLSRS